MASMISLKGIEQSISNLNYGNKNALTYRLVNTMRQFYEDEDAVESIQGIDTDELIRMLWNTGDELAIIRNRRKNLSSVKSSVNADLKKLYKEGKNPEGIIIGPNNIFVMSDEAKDDALKAFKNRLEAEGTVSLDQVTEVLNLVNDILSNPEAIADVESGGDLGKLDQLKGLIRGLSEKVGLEGPVKNLMRGSSEKVGLEGPELTGSAAEASEDLEYLEEAQPLEEVLPEEEIESDEAQEVEDIEEFDEEEAIEELQDVEIDDALEDEEAEDEPEEVEDFSEDAEDDLEEVDTEEGLNEVETEDASEEAEDELEEAEDISEDAEEDLEEVEAEDDLEGADVAEETEETDLSAGDSGAGYSDGGYEEDDEIRKARLLAEEFNSLLGARDKYYNQYILIPQGEYTVGNLQPKKDARLEQVVHLSPFYIGKFPITNALFEIFVEKTGYRTTAEKSGFGTVYRGRFQKRVDEKTGLERTTWNSALVKNTVEGACWYQPLGQGSMLHNKRNHPVVQVSLDDAMAFAAWTGKRLPTEDEWEAASRTAHGYVFPWGNDWEKDSCNIEESSIGDTTPVDRYIAFANEFGIADAVGNVLEWTSDRYEPSSYAKNESQYYICKGGSWISGSDIRLFSRFQFEPDSPSNILAFRCVAY